MPTAPALIGWRPSDANRSPLPRAGRGAPADRVPGDRRTAAGRRVTWLKILLIVGLWLAVPIATAVAAGRSDRWRRVLIAVTVFSFAWSPLATLDYQIGSHYNARGWEFCFAEVLALGLLLAR